MEKIKFLERDKNGKKNKVLISEGFIPAVVYNSKGESTNIMVEASSAKKISREATSTTILNAEFDGKEMKTIVKEIDFNPVTDSLRHIAFFEIDETADMLFSIPFKTVGVSPAVKNNLGVLVEVLQDIEVRCKVKDLLPFIEVNISKLEHPGQTISIDELNIPESITLVNEDLKHATVVTITELQKETIVEETAEEGEEAEEGAEGEKGEGEDTAKGEDEASE